MKCLTEPFFDIRREYDFGAWDVGAMKFKARQLTQMANYEILIDRGWSIVACVHKPRKKTK